MITADVLELSKVEILNMVLENSVYYIQCQSTEDSATCPTCFCKSSAVHSYYQRSIQDLPIAGKTVFLQLNQRRFRCKNPECPAGFFTQTFPFVETNAKKTLRLESMIQRLSIDMSTIQATAVLKSMGILTCKSSLSDYLKKRL